MEYKNLEEQYTAIFQDKVLPFIRRNLPNDFLTAPVYHLLEGLSINRFRGSLPLIIAEQYDRNPDSMLPLAALCEMTFNTAMAQDDYYDGDESRQGLTVAHSVFGIKETLLSCDYVNHKLISILNESLQHQGFSELKRNRIVSIANEAMASWYLSVLMELNSRKDPFSVDEDYVRKIYLSKTIHGRMLLECAFLMVQDDERVLHTIQEYSEHLAMAGQLKNDIYDFTKHRQYRGLSDLRQGHITWPLFLLIGSLRQTEKKDLQRCLDDNEHEKVIALLRQHRILDKLLGMIDFHVDEAKRLTATLPESIKSVLVTWADGNRNFSRPPVI
jgi:geranylgeranyl pyrophosphate synthase